MKFSAKEDVDKPVDQVFTQLTQFNTFERAAIRRGAEIERVSDAPVPMVGMAWNARFQLRGRTRKARVTLTQLDAPNDLCFDAIGQSFDGTFAIELIPLSPRSTRISVAAEIRPKTLSARLLVQSMRLAKSNLNRRFRKRIKEFVVTL